MYVHPSRANKTTLNSKTLSKEKTEEVAKSKDTSYIIGFALGAIILVWAAIMAHSHTLTGWQAQIFYDFDNLSLPAFFPTLAKWLTELLGAAYPIAICALVAALYKRYRLAWRFLFTSGGTSAVFYIVKKVINEPRPIAMLHGNLHQRVVETGPGFPSGHESAATALALTLWLILPRQWPGFRLSGLQSSPYRVCTLAFTHPETSLAALPSVLWRSASSS